MSDKPAAAPLTAERVQAMLDGSPFIRFFGMQVAAIDAAAGRLVLAMELRPELERRQGTGQWHGGALAGLIDTAGDFAVALAGC
jgi:acyl-coenzyme A thioesterase PaaI-like protein